MLILPAAYLYFCSSQENKEYVLVVLTPPDVYFEN